MITMMHMQLNHIILQYFCNVPFMLSVKLWLQTVILRLPNITIQYVIILNNFQHIVVFFLIIIHLTFSDKHGKRWTSLRTRTAQSVLIKNEFTSLATNCQLAPKTMWSLCRIFRCLALHRRVNTQHGKSFSFLSQLTFLKRLKRRTRVKLYLEL